MLLHQRGIHIPLYFAREYHRLQAPYVTAKSECRPHLGGHAAGHVGCGRVAQSACQLAGTAGVLGGGYMVKSGIDKHAEAKLHAQSLEELSRSLNSEIQPHTIELQDRTVTLTGTVDQQYNQWRQILQEMYRSETGQPPAAEAAK